MRALLFLLILSVLVACGGAPAPTPATVEAALTAAGGSAFARGRIDGPVPQSYTDHADFMIGDKGGQYFICQDKDGCDALFAYYDALQFLAGPYLYRNQSGTVVVQLNSGLLPDEAAKYKDAVERLP